MAGTDPWSTGLAVGGSVANLFQGGGAAKAEKEMRRRQAQTIQLQNQNFLAAQPYFKQALDQAAMYAGLGDGVTRGADGSYQLGAMPGQRPGGLGSSWGNREDQLRLQAAEEDINRRQQQAANWARFQQGRAGISEGAQSATLGRIASQGQQDYSRFRRDLEINAVAERERRMAALQNLIAQGFGQGSQAAAGFGQQAGAYGQQAASAFGNINNIIQQYQFQRALQGLPQPTQQPAGGVLGTPTPTSAPSWWSRY